MAKINLKQVKFSNLLSYGATETVIDIQDGVNWIRGANGYGKSTIIEAINFALFGKAYRDISLASLINNYNQRKLLVELVIEQVIADTTKTYIIRRGLKPKIFEIYRDSIDSKNRIDEEGKAGIYQSFLETEILGFNETLFKQTIAMSAMSSTPFLEMGKPDKRKFIESILGVSDIEKIKKAFGSELSDMKSDFLKISSKIPERQSKLEELEDILENAKKEKVGDISALKNEIGELKIKIEDEKARVNKLIEIREAKKEEGKLVADEYDDYKNVKSDISSKQATMRSSEELLDKNKKKMEAISKELQSLSEYTEGALDELKNAAKELKLSFADINDLRDLRSGLKYKIESLNSKIKDLNRHLDEHKVGVPCDRCQRPYTESDYDAIKKSVDAEIADYISEIEISTTKSRELDVKIAEMEKFAEQYKELTERGISYKSKLNEKESKEKLLKSIIEENVDLENKIVTLSSDIKELNTKVTKADILNAKLTKLKTEFLEAKAEVQVGENKITSFNDSIELIEKKIKDRESNKIDDIITTTLERVNQAKNEIKSGKQRVSELSEEIEILQYIVKMFGDEGIKEYMIKKYIPVLNTSIDKVLKSFGVPFTISFDSTMEHTFDNSFGLAKEYKGLSEGQKRRLNFSIYIAFREFVNKIGRFTINALFLDEILDTAMDDGGLEDMISIIKSKEHSLGAVYLISHKVNSLNEEFKNVLEVKFDGTFSTLEVCN